MHGRQNIKSEEMFTDISFLNILMTNLTRNIATAKIEAIGWKENNQP